MNTKQLNQGGKVRGVGMARMDILDYDRKSEQIFDPEVTDALAILAFLGEEPLLNRSLVRECTELGQSLSEDTGIGVSFSITTNGTLLTVEDGEFFERHGFAVTISLDGIGETHDGLRPFRGGQGSYAKIIANVRPLLEMQQRMQVSACVTVTPRNLRLRETLDELLGLGFHSVGVSPMLHAPSGREEMHGDDAGQHYRRRWSTGRNH